MKNTVILSIEAKRAMLDIIKEMLEKLDYLEQDNTRRYDVIGKSDRPQRRALRDEDGNLIKNEDGERIYEDVIDEDGNIVYQDEYGYLDYDEETATETQKAYKLACDNMRKALEKMI